MVGDQHGNAFGMIVLCTDFGLEGPYTGQVKAVLARAAPAVPVIDLFADLPPFRPQAAAYLLAAYGQVFVPGDVIVGVVDPGSAARGRARVGSGRALVRRTRQWDIRARAAARAGGALLADRLAPGRAVRDLSRSDLFAPVAAGLARGEAPPGKKAAPTRYPDWPDDLAEIVYVDRYGNAMTGLRAAVLPAGTELEVADVRIPRARTFSDVPPGALLWYANANGLAEIAAHGASVAASSNSRQAPGWRCIRPAEVVTPSRPAYVRAHSWGVAKR